MIPNKYKPGMKVRVLPIDEWRSTNARYQLSKHGKYYGIPCADYREMENHIYTVKESFCNGAESVFLKEVRLYLPICTIELADKHFNKLLSHSREVIQ